MLILLLNHSEGIPKSDYRKPPLYLAARAINRNLLALYNAHLIEVVPNPIQIVHRLTKDGVIVAKKLVDILNTIDYRN